MDKRRLPNSLALKAETRKDFPVRVYNCLMPVKKRTTRRTKEASQVNPQTWLERAQAMLVYSNALKDADEKVLKLFDAVADQTKKYFEFNSLLYRLTIGLISGVLLLSFLMAFFVSDGNIFFQIYSLVGLVSAIIALIILLMRNPLKQARNMLENTIRVNVVFLSFVRRLQQSDLALRYVFMQNKDDDFKKIYAQIQEFQNMIDQTSDEINQVLRDFGE
jgi:hypothetical protein